MYMIVLLVLLMYLIYMMSLPINMEDELTKLFKFIAIFNWIVAAVLGCMGFIFVKKMLEELNQGYAKTVFAEAIVFISAQLLSGGFCFWLGSGGI